MSIEELKAVLPMLAKLLAAFLLGLPVGWEREYRRGLSPGLRTYPLLSMGACAFMQIGEHAFPQHPDAQARVFQAILTGIGFIGGGAIIKGRAKVFGLATAVSLWMTVAIGIGVAHGMYVLSGAVSVATLAALEGLRPFKKGGEPDQGPPEEEE